MKTLSKSVLVSFIFFSAQLRSYAQSFTDELEIVKVVAGINEWNQNKINATQYKFGTRIYKIYIDSLSNNATVQLRDVNSDHRSIRNKGEYLLLNLKSKDVKWRNSITYTEGFLNQNTNVLLEVYGNRSYRINMQTGKSEMTYDNRIFHIDKASKTGMVFIRLTRGETSAKLLGVDLTSGNIRWKQEIKKDYSRCKLSQLNDTTILFITSGLHTINPRNGKGWNYDVKTGDKNYRDPDQKAAQSTLGGVERSDYDVFNGRSLIHGAESKILAEGDYWYFASQEKIAKIDKSTGRISWSFDFKNNDAGVSWLYLKDSTIFMVSAGYAIKKNEKITLDKPFIAAFNKNTGQPIFQNTLSPKEQIISTKCNGELLFFLYNNELASYNLSTNQFISKKKTTKSKDEEVNLCFPEEELYINYGDSLSPEFRVMDVAKPYVVTNTHALQEFENDLTLTQTSDDRLLYNVIAKKNGFKILAQQDKTTLFVLDASNKVMAKLNAPFNSQLIGNYLYGIEDNTLVETDLTEILK